MRVEAFAARPGFQELPRAAAASDDRSLDERRFEGGRVRVVTSERDAEQIYIIFEFDDPVRLFAALVLEGQNGELEKLRFGPLDETGVVQVMLDTRSMIALSASSGIRGPWAYSHDCRYPLLVWRQECLAGMS
jgi:hypothetical protein